MTDGPDAPILRNKLYDAPSVFTPDNILREARRQKGLGARNVPNVCVLDPDGDVVRHLKNAGRARREEASAPSMVAFAIAWNCD
jgi:uridine phosphorylase